MEDAVIVGCRLTSHTLDREQEPHLPDEVMVVEGYTLAERFVFARGK